MSEKEQSTNHLQTPIPEELFYSPEDSLALTPFGMHVHKAMQAFSSIADEMHTPKTRQMAIEKFELTCREVGFGRNGTVDMQSFQITAQIIYQVQEKHNKRISEFIRNLKISKKPQEVSQV